jgi:hypothetical protein
MHDHRYTIITPNDIVIPPDDASDYLWKYFLEELSVYGEPTYTIESE